MYEDERLFEDYPQARPTSLPISSTTDVVLDNQRKRLENCRKTLESTLKESKIVDLEIAQFQLKIQECIDKTASSEMIAQELDVEIEKQLREKENYRKVLSDMSLERVKSLSADQKSSSFDCYEFIPSAEETPTLQGSVEEEWACPACSTPNTLLSTSCSQCSHSPNDISNCVILRDY